MNGSKCLKHYKYKVSVTYLLTNKKYTHVISHYTKRQVSFLVVFSKKGPIINGDNYSTVALSNQIPVLEGKIKHLSSLLYPIKIGHVDKGTSDCNPLRRHLLVRCRLYLCPIGEKYVEAIQSDECFTPVIRFIRYRNWKQYHKVTFSGRKAVSVLAITLLCISSRTLLDWCPFR